MANDDVLRKANGGCVALAARDEEVKDAGAVTVAVPP
jgi:hypothetical protein